MPMEQPEGLSQQQEYDVPAVPNGSVCIAGRQVAASLWNRKPQQHGSDINQT